MLSAAYFVTSNVSAVIGDTVSRLSEYSATVTSAVHIPQCSFTSISDDLSSKTLYDYFIRTVPAGDNYAVQLLEYISRMGWRRIGIIYSSNSFGVPFATSIVRRAPSYGVMITHWDATYTPDNDSQDFKDTLGSFRSLGSYINVILCTDADTLRGLETIYNEGMAGHPYVWISFNDITRDIRTYFSEPNRPPASVFDGLIMADLAYDFVGNPQYDKFLTRWQSLDPALYPGAGPESTLSHAEPRAYSCVWMLALGYKRDIENARQKGANATLIHRDLVTGQFPRTFGNLSVDLFHKITFDGPAGKVYLDENGNRIGGAWVFYQMQKNVTVAVASSTLTPDGEQSMTIFPGKHVWPRSRYNQTPLDSPPWVQQNLNWGEPLAIVLVTIAALITLVCLIMIGIVVWKRHNPVIKASSPCFCILELIGIIMLCASVPMKMGTTTGPICYTIALSFMGGINLILSAIVVKNYRVYRIFSNVYSNKIVMKDTVLLKHAGVLLLTTMSATLVYLAVARPRVVYFTIDPSSTAHICLPTNGDNISGSIQMVMAIPTAFLLGFAWFLAYKTRGVSANWNEARAISYVVYNLVFTALMYTASTLLYRTMYRPSTIIQDVVILYAGLVCLIVLFVPKVIVIWQQDGLKNSRTLSVTSHNDDLHHQFGGVGNHLAGRMDGMGSVGSVATFGFGGRDGGMGVMGETAAVTGVQELRVRPLDPDIVFSKETGTVMTFEQFEDRLNETTIVASKSPRQKNTAGAFNSYTSNSRPRQQRSATFPPILQPINPTILRSLSLEHKTSCCSAGPESYGLSDSPDIWNSDGSNGGGGRSTGSEFMRRTSRVAPDEVAPPLEQEGIPLSTIGGNRNNSEQDAYNRPGPVLGLGPMNTGSSFSSSTIYGGSGIGGNGGVNEFPGENSNNIDYNQFRMGIFSFGIKDDTQTIPVLIIDKRRWRWFLQFTARWRAMQIIVVSSLNMVILSDQGAKKLRSETFFYTRAEPFTEPGCGGHFYLRVTCLNNRFLQLEFPNAIARDQWSRVFNASSSSSSSSSLEGRNLSRRIEKSGGRGCGNGRDGLRGGGGMGGGPLSTTTPVSSLNLHGNRLKTRSTRNPLKWIQRHHTTFESAGPEVHAQKEEESERRGGLDRFSGKGGLGADADRRRDNHDSWMDFSGLTHESSSSSDLDLSSPSAAMLLFPFSETGVYPQVGKECTGQELNDQQSNVPR
ncbi:hypothetical protein F5H01DRAFT_411064 [Linnemannia elongata]|nr:hypothetical protein F5H01DRAFT_411064 [Linnemannia elongata]